MASTPTITFKPDPDTSYAQPPELSIGNEIGLEATYDPDHTFRAVFRPESMPLLSVPHAIASADEYRIAADCLEENGFYGIAGQLREIAEYAKQ